MNEYEHFLDALYQLHDKDWANKYFNLLKKLFVDLGIQNDDTRIAMNVRKDLAMPVNIGARWIAMPIREGLIGLIIPINQNPEALTVQHIGFFTKQKMNDAEWVGFDLLRADTIPDELYNAWREACVNELAKSKKSFVRKFHNSLYYDAVMEEEARKEMLDEAFEGEDNR